MCCCGKPTVNGEQGYSWDGKSFGVRQPDPPQIAEDEVLLFDEPGRCGGVDSHAQHCRVVKGSMGRVLLIVRSGLGDRRIRLSNERAVLESLNRLDSNGRYWLLNAISRADFDARSEAAAEANSSWRKAAAEKRIKTRKMPGQNRVKVWIES